MKENKLQLITQKYNHKKILQMVICQQIEQNRLIPRNIHLSKTDHVK